MFATITTRNVYGTNLISRDASGAKAFYLYNGHHDVVQLMTSTGSVVASYYYDAFGVILEESGSGSNPYRYSGYFYDSETTLYYLKARFYDAGLARFLQEDSYYGSAGDPLSLNLYTYVSNNPLVYWDPSGHYVSPTDKANLSSAQIKQLENATNAWDAANKAGDKAGMAAANASANAIRASAGYSGGANGNTVTVSSGNTVKTVIIADNTNVKNSGTITTVNVLTGATSTITNSGAIETVNNRGTTTISNSGKIGTVNNGGTIGSINNTGTIGVINNSGTTGNINNMGTVRTVNNSGVISTIHIGNNGSIGAINNSHTISSIVAGKNSSVGVINAGLINNIVMGAGSALNVNNSGLINNILIDNYGALHGNNAGYVGSVVVGTGGKATNQWATSPVTQSIVSQSLSDLGESFSNILKLEYELGLDLEYTRNDVLELMRKVRAIGASRTIDVSGPIDSRIVTDMNATERVLYASDKAKGTSMGYAAYVAKAAYDVPNGDGKLINAKLHAYWNALAVYYTGDSEYVRLFTNAHEYGGPWNLTAGKADNGVLIYQNAMMDLHNNRVGRELSAAMAWRLGEFAEIEIMTMIEAYTEKELAVVVK